MHSSINYKHLKYFWVVANEGSIAKASAKLHITPQTISGQLSLLEDNLASTLFEREGRGLKLTDTGRLVLGYADEIFSLGRELSDVLRGMPNIGPSEFIVGAASSLPKTIVQKIIEPGLLVEQDITLTSLEGPVDMLLADLAIHKVDMVLSDTPLTGTLNIKAYNHKLGETGLTFFASPKLAKQLKHNFPQSLNGAPTLMPTSQYSIRKQIDFWLNEQQLYPMIKGQFDDSALMKSFGQAGLGAFFMPSIIVEEVCKNFAVEVIGHVNEVKQEFYAISAERKIKHPAVSAICNNARTSLFV
ncbi:transcriptional activator NhaR [Paraglaciecola aquimarina]|uniref:Transcriptional activator NhaR n=1 Tax=Paraglaciecola algarum TaxID=3050085 RepID=A0ABS9D5V1_9ALTE|nr:transcriptional activator NhaR [Paraglaciecola sp. G1-23]MCF2947051.1 transcriptional activator NhaR [Paraglaciecola sp. G1-23]